jgi:hypothetical protein
VSLCFTDTSWQSRHGVSGHGEVLKLSYGGSRRSQAANTLVFVSQMINQESPLDEIGTQINDQAIRLAKNYERTGSLEHLNDVTARSIGRVAA